MIYRILQYQLLHMLFKTQARYRYRVPKLSYIFIEKIKRDIALHAQHIKYEPHTYHTYTDLLLI